MKKIEVVAAIIEHQGKYLATRRGYGEFINKWEFPGGKIEPGETKEEALTREIREEMAAAINIEQFVSTIDYDYPDFHLTMHNFLCTIKDNKFQLLEHNDAKWLRKDELDTVDWLPADRLVIEDLLKMLNDR